jgi:hypothetical protein
MDFLCQLYNNVKKLDGKNSLDSLVKRLRNPNIKMSNFQGAAFEAEFAADNPNNVYALGMKTEGVTGETDVVMKEGNDLVGYECKSGNYGTSTYDQRELNIYKDRFELLKQKGIINNYKIMFREKPRQDVIDWMNNKAIQWDYFVK